MSHLFVLPASVSVVGSAADVVTTVVPIVKKFLLDNIHIREMYL